MFPTQHRSHEWVLGVQHPSRQLWAPGPHHQVLRWFCEFMHRCSRKYDRGHMETRQIHLRPTWENKVKRVRNVVTSSLSAGFIDVSESIVKRCVQFITITLVHIVHLSFPTGYFPDIICIRLCWVIIFVLKLCDRSIILTVLSLINFKKFGNSI